VLVANPGMIAVAMGNYGEVNRLPGVYIKIPLLAVEACICKTDQVGHAIKITAIT